LWSPRYSSQGSFWNRDISIARRRPTVNDGNLLLRFRNNAGDTALKEHLESWMRNATYISPKIQNEIVATCGDIIVEDIANRITHSSFFSVLAEAVSLHTICG
jgi:hypothetical protein